MAYFPHFPLFRPGLLIRDYGRRVDILEWLFHDRPQTSPGPRSHLRFGRHADRLATRPDPFRQCHAPRNGPRETERTNDFLLHRARCPAAGFARPGRPCKTARAATRVAIFPGLLRRTQAGYDVRVSGSGGNHGRTQPETI